MKSFLYRTTCLTGAAFIYAAALQLPALANPQDDTVTARAANISESGKALDIHQSTERAVIDWRTFNIAPDETTAFHQPGTTSITLNRVNYGGPSQIMGRLTANGNIVIVNPSGVLFGASAK